MGYGLWISLSKFRKATIHVFKMEFERPAKIHKRIYVMVKIETLINLRKSHFCPSLDTTECWTELSMYYQLH